MLHFIYDSASPYSIDSAFVMGYRIFKEGETQVENPAIPFFYGEISHEPACRTIESGH